MPKVLLNTNVLMHALDESFGHCQRCRALLRNPDYDFYATSQNRTKYFAICTKLYIPERDFWPFYQSIQQKISFLNPNEKSTETLENLIKKYKPRGRQVFDLEIVSIMLAHDLKLMAHAEGNEFEKWEEVELLVF